MTLMITVAISSLSLILVPEDGKGVSGYTRLAVSLCVLSVTISPIASFISRLRSIELDDFSLGNLQSKASYEEIYEDMLCVANESFISEKTEDLICRDFNIERGQVRVFAELYSNDDEYKLRCVKVMLSGAAIAKNPHEIKEYVTSLLSCECEIVYI